MDAAQTAGPYTGCEHYRRKVQLLAPCCGEWFACRFCHDAVKDEGVRDYKVAHKLDRKLVRRVKCMRCGAEQAPARECTSCANVLGEYFCAVCNLFDDEGAHKGIFHCAECGICRVGGRASFVHCGGCRMCIAVGTAGGAHKCALYDSACPVCMEDVASSRKSPTRLQGCPHVLHGDCLQTLLTAGQYRCPLCQKSMVDMSREWRRQDGEWVLEMLPRELRHKRVRVCCNDCNKEGETPFSLGGLRCLQPECGSFNTKRVGQGMTEAAEGASFAHPVRVWPRAPRVSTGRAMVLFQSLSGPLSALLRLPLLPHTHRTRVVTSVKECTDWVFATIEAGAADAEGGPGSVAGGLAAAVQHAALGLFGLAPPPAAPLHDGAEGVDGGQHDEVQAGGVEEGEGESGGEEDEDVGGEGQDDDGGEDEGDGGEGEGDGDDGAAGELGEAEGEAAVGDGADAVLRARSSAAVASLRSVALELTGDPAAAAAFVARLEDVLGMTH